MFCVYYSHLIVPGFTNFYDYSTLYLNILRFGPEHSLCLICRYSFFQGRKKEYVGTCNGCYIMRIIMHVFVFYLYEDRNTLQAEPDELHLGSWAHILFQGYLLKIISSYEIIANITYNLRLQLKFYTVVFIFKKMYYFVFVMLITILMI